MPGFDGTGPLGQGPMTGQGRGFCVLISSEENPNEVKGFAGIDGKLIDKTKMIESLKFAGKEVINMPFGDGTGPAGLGPMTGRAAGFCAGYPVPGYMNPAVGRAGFYGAGVPALGAYGTGHRIPYSGWGRRGLGRGFGRGWGRGRGRGRSGYW